MPRASARDEIAVIAVTGWRYPSSPTIPRRCAKQFQLWVNQEGANGEGNQRVFFARYLMRILSTQHFLRGQKAMRLLYTGLIAYALLSSCLHAQTSPSKPVDDCPGCNPTPKEKRLMTCNARLTDYNKSNCSRPCTSNCNNKGRKLKPCIEEFGGEYKTNCPAQN
jgi:hypothetical protein